VSDIKITNGLWFLKDPRGATLHFLFSAPGQKVADAFGIGMSHSSLKDCRKALDSDSVFWRNKDKSLTVEGTRDEITLSFALLGPPYGRRIITLSGPTLTAFRSAIELLGGN
jgi:hypothetical protein